MHQSTIEADSAAKEAARAIERLTNRLHHAESAQARALESVVAIQIKLNASSTATEELDKVRADMQAAESLAYAEMERAEQYKVELNSLRFERERLQEETVRLRTHTESFEEGEAKKLLDFWSIHYPKMQFDRQPVRWIIKKPHRERMSFEKKLMELHASDDPAALSLGKMRVEDEHHLAFKVGGTECRMYYRVNGSVIVVTRLGTNQETH